ncbi:hypothetical protein Btru_063198 [Bulinus truncatus]|nr:hypothetical protein Btru_063198 [Bulinus truncatus]
MTGDKVITMSSSTLLIIFTISSVDIFASGQVSNPVVSLENNNVRLTFNIPFYIQEGIVHIALENGNGRLLSLVIEDSSLIIMHHREYSNRLDVTPSWAERTLYVDFQGVRSADAGMYKCYNGINYNVIASCGQNLVIVRKPNKPTVQELTSALEGANLKLACMTNSTSLPTDHGLKSAILWRNEQNQVIGVPGTDKLSLDAVGHLVIKNIQHTDKGLKLTCTSSDIAEGITSSPESDPSQVYEVKAELKPSVSDILLTPTISGDDKISLFKSEDLTYTCDITCNPACIVQWSFKSVNSSSFVPLQLADPKTLKKTVQRADHGTYRCSATNKHGVASVDFELEVLYISSPVISLNDKSGDNIRVQENQPVTLKCVIDAMPAPKISWKSNKVLSTETGKDPKVSKDTVLKNVYTSEYSLSSVQCEDNGVYSCEVTNEVSTLEGRINMVVLCPPTRADVDGLKLEQEYVWELSKSLTFSFVIKALPEPNVINVSSRVHKDYCNSKTTATALSKTTATVMSKTTATVMSKTTATVMSKTTATVMSKTTATVMSKTTATVMSKTTATVMSKTTATVKSKTTATVKGKTTATVKSKTTATVMSKTTATVKSKTTATVKGKTTATVKSKTTATVKGKTTATVKSKTTATVKATVKSKTTATVKSKTTATVKSKTTASVKSKTKATVMSKTTATVKSKTTATVKSKTTATVKSKTTASVKSKTTATVKSKTTATVKSKTTATVMSKTTATVKSNELQLL